jgi:hypothetical protein
MGQCIEHDGQILDAVVAIKIEDQDDIVLELSAVGAPPFIIEQDRRRRRIVRAMESACRPTSSQTRFEKNRWPAVARRSGGRPWPRRQSRRSPHRNHAARRRGDSAGSWLVRTRDSPRALPAPIRLISARWNAVTTFRPHPASISKASTGAMGGSIGRRCLPAELPKLSRGQPGLRASSSMVTATAPFADRRTFCPSTSATRLKSI